MRFRFTSPHPKDFPTEVLELIRDRPNICKSLHLPAQSGNNRILSLMRRNYTREAYLDLVDNIFSVCGPQVSLSSDFICGFCSETEEDFHDTMDLVQRVPYNIAYIFAYSTREVQETFLSRLCDSLTAKENDQLSLENDGLSSLPRRCRDGCKK